ncbi:MAG: TetR/AcrR family transcriptional regulator [Vulcanimicrobiota bacterium]
MSPGPRKQFDPSLALERAMHVFWRHGFAGTSMSQLLAEMGIGKKSLYDTFGNKRELFLQTLDLYAAQNLEGLRAVLEKPGPALENLRELLGSPPEGSCRGCFLGTNMADFELEDKEVAARICGHLKRIEQELEKILDKAREQGEFGRGQDPARLSRLLSCLGQGTALVGRVGDCPQRQQDALDAVFELLRRST